MLLPDSPPGGPRGRPRFGLRFAPRLGRLFGSRTGSPLSATAIALLLTALGGCASTASTDAPALAPGEAPTAASPAPEASPSPEADPSPSRDDEPIDRELALQTFDSAWSRINTSYYDPDFRGIDWVGVRDELRPVVAEVETLGELRTAIRDMLSRLGESHFSLFPQESVDAIQVDDDGEAGGETGDLGMEVRWVEGEMTVFRVHEGAAREAGVRPGWIVDAIGDREMEVWKGVVAEAETDAARIALRTQTVSGAASLMTGASGTSVTLRVRDGDDASRTLTLERGPVKGEMVKFLQLPAMPAYLDFERVERAGGCLGVIEFNIWMIPLVPEFNRAVDALADCTGIVIDVRGNRGGVGGMVMATAGSFFAERADLGIIQSRAGEIRFVAMPRGVDTEGRLRQAFEGRLALLIDELSMSTSEVFAAGLKSTGRARLFGTTTPGYALPALTMRLPSQDVLYHVVSNLTDPEGVRIEGQGVAPDESMPLRRSELLAGRDAALERALEWVGGGG